MPRWWRRSSASRRRAAPTTLTFFEYNTLAALLIFAERAVEVAVLEVGLGGRLDATNLIDADVAVLASVGFDHRDWLGDTLELIGAEKAGIFRAQRAGRARHAATCPRACSPRSRARGRAGGGGRARLQLAAGTRTGWDYRGLKVTLSELPPSALAGDIQYRNAATALAALEALEAVPAAPVARLQARAGAAHGGERSAGRCAACTCPGASRLCRARWSGSWTSRTTSRPRRCSPRSCARVRCRRARTARHAPSP